MSQIRPANRRSGLRLSHARRMHNRGLVTDSKRDRIRLMHPTVGVIAEPAGRLAHRRTSTRLTNRVRERARDTRQESARSTPGQAVDDPVSTRRWWSDPRALAVGLLVVFIEQLALFFVLYLLLFRGADRKWRLEWFRRCGRFNWGTSCGQLVEPGTQAHGDASLCCAPVARQSSPPSGGLQRS